MLFIYSRLNAQPLSNEDIPFNHKLKIELDLQSLFGLLCITAVLYSLAETLQLPPPAFGLKDEGAVGQSR
jgi:hypothetical protein